MTAKRLLNHVREKKMLFKLCTYLFCMSFVIVCKIFSLSSLHMKTNAHTHVVYCNVIIKKALECCYFSANNNYCYIHHELLHNFSDLNLGVSARRRISMRALDVSQVQLHFSQTIQLVRWCKGRQLDTVNIWMVRRVFRIYTRWCYALDDWLSRWALYSPASPYRSYFIRKEQGVV